MADNGKSTKDGNASSVFRQFAWHLAGTLAKPATKPRPAGKR